MLLEHERIKCGKTWDGLPSGRKNRNNKNTNNNDVNNNIIIVINNHSAHSLTHSLTRLRTDLARRVLEAGETGTVAEVLCL